jgi:maleylacetoacetate isomerase
MATTDKLTLYTYYRSSCSGRLRIALHLKNLIPHTTYNYVNLLSGQQKENLYQTINPSGTVPTLLITHADGTTTKITQSLAALEYLDDAYPDTYQLLPRDPATRAKVRELAHILAVDVQPVTNLKMLVRIGDLGGDRAAYARDLMARGFAAYEALIKDTAGRFSVGDEITLADVVLAPAYWGAVRFGVDFGDMPTVRGVMERLEGEECVRVAKWNCQPDTPEELRGKEK